MFGTGKTLNQRYQVPTSCVTSMISGQLHCHSERSVAESKNLLPERCAWVKDASSAYRLPQHDIA